MCQPLPCSRTCVVRGFCSAGKTGGLASLLVQECLQHCVDATAATSTSSEEWRSGDLDLLAHELMENVNGAGGSGGSVVGLQLLAELVAGASGVSLLRPQALERVLSILLVILRGGQHPMGQCWLLLLCHARGLGIGLQLDPIPTQI